MPPHWVGHRHYFVSEFFELVVVYNFSFLSSELKANLHRRGSLSSFHPWRIGFPCGDNTVTSSFLNTTVQFASKIGLTPMSVFVKVGIM